MNVYDFDNTIYDGESILDFFYFYFKKEKGIIQYVPLIGYTLILYKLNLLPLEKLYELASKLSIVISQNKEKARKLAEEFWCIHERKLKPQFLEKIKSEDIIITASPSILIDVIKEKLNTENIITTEINLETGVFEFICYGKNKVQKWKEKYPNTTIDEFYTDSLSDKPLMEQAKKVYLIKRGKAPKLIQDKK